MVNAGMLEAMDFHIGRLVRYLEERGLFDDTIFVITSDNGPEFGMPTDGGSFRLWMWANGYDDDLDRLGEKGSMVSIGPEWASAASSPGRLFKFYASEGGTRVPLIVSGPGVSRQGFHGAMAFATDVTPTVLSLAGVSDEIRDRGEPMTGRSLKGLLDGSRERAHPVDVPIGMEVSGNAWLYKGKYKLVKNSLPHGDGSWRIHDIANDPAESRDLSTARPELKAELLSDYAAYAAAMGVAPTPADFDIVEQIRKNTTGRLVARHRAALVGLLSSVVLLAVWFGARALRGSRGIGRRF
jgi:arylsulfatase A-like enzyme